ncbi:Na(+)/H(+) antiporter NhaP [invertebrate metagenome]|uniref:Na(+)/H(+) antiporter NhaP n=1 Tax=invertebrate metagenome TaxID=1711999 RepID=A0A2H9T720_9ZZZZ
MSTYELLCLLSALALIAALLSSKISRIQTTSAITLIALCLSLLLIAGGKLFDMELHIQAIRGLDQLDFHSLLIDGLLGFLLFAGALNIRLSVLKSQGWEILVLSLFSTLLSTLIVGWTLWFTAPFTGTILPFPYCLLFGALISPTDPIAVLAIIKKLGAPREISIQIEGESLFNDGIGLVLFVAMSQWAFSEIPLTLTDISWLFIREAIGGLLFGLVIFAVLHYLIMLCDDDSQKMLLTLLAPTTGYVAASLLSVSAPLAMVSCGIALGNWTGMQYFNRTGRKSLSRFWFFIEEYFNSLLFLLIGLLLLLVSFHRENCILMMLAIPIVLFARVISVILPYLCFRCFRHYNPLSEYILIWGGLRGGLALAMAMSLPSGIMLIPEKQIDLKELLMLMTYAVVMFSILIQGATIKNTIQKSNTASINIRKKPSRHANANANVTE